MAEVLQQQVMQGGVGQHDADLIQTGCNLR